jgi:hypothetical protein
MLKKIIIFLVALALIVFGVMYAAAHTSFSDGERAGTVSKFSHKGYVFKTYEGELNVGGFAGGTGNMVPQIWQFSVDEDNQKTIEDLKVALTNGHRVSLSYEERYVKFFWLGDTQYFVTKVTFAK